MILIALCIGLMTLSLAVGVQSIQVHRLRKRLDATQFYHTQRIWAELYRLKGRHADAQLLEDAANHWSQYR